MLFNTSWQVEVVTDRIARRFAVNDIRLHQFDVNLDWTETALTRDLAARGGPYTPLDSRLEAIAKMDPKALVLLRVHLMVPGKWLETRPDEILTAEDGTRIDMRSPYRAATSYASRRWRQEAGRRLEAMIRHLELTGLRRHVLGYLLFAGRSGEWNWWVPPRGDLPGARYAQLANMCADHSAAMQEAFRAWVRERYQTVDQLRHAWEDPTATFGSVSVPTEKVVSAALSAQFNDPRKCRAVSDYFRCNAKQVAGSLLYFARVAKAADPDRLCGAFFGEFLFSAIGGNREILRTGHLDIDRVLRSPDIDFLCTPNCYQSRRIGGHSPTMTLEGSARLHGKLVFYEADQPTHLYRPPEGKDQLPADVPRNPDETLAMLWRDFSYALCNGLGIWWWDQQSRCTKAVVDGVWYRSEEILDAFGKMQEIGQRALSMPWCRRSEIAVLYDPRSALYQRCAWRDLTRTLIYEQVDALGKMGAPYELYSLADLPKLPDFRLYIVWNAAYLDDAQRAMLNRHLKRGGHTVLWLGAPGCLSPEGIASATASSLVGLKLRELPDGRSLQGMIAPEGNPLVAGLSGVIGHEVTAAPHLVVEDPEAAVLMRNPSSGEVVAAARKFSDWTTIWAGVSPLPAQFLRNVAREAGCHIYLDTDDVIYAGGPFVATHFRTPGPRVVKLPSRFRIVDAISGEFAAQKAAEIKLNITSPTTRLWVLSPGR